MNVNKDGESITLPARGSKQRRRRLQGACDACKKRKIKCDRANMPDECTNCIVFNIPCTQTLTRRTLLSRTANNTKPAGEPDHISRLEKKVKELEQRLGYDSSDGHSDASGSGSPPPQSYPELDSLLVSVLDNPEAFFATSTISTLRKQMTELARYTRMFRERLDDHHGPDRSRKTSSNGTSGEGSQSGTRPEPAGADSLAADLELLCVDSKNYKLFGRASDLSLINDTMVMKKQVVGSQASEADAPSKRMVHWKTPKFERDLDDPDAPLEFPDQDLMYTLVNHYFDTMNFSIPFLHKPSFLKSLSGGLHHRDSMFGCLVLAVCALGAANKSDDPRVISPEEELPKSRGIEYVKRIWRTRTAFMVSKSLYEIQLICVLCNYMHANCSGEGVYSMVGAGIRFLQELGVHRANGTQDTMEGELWRRVFWIFVCMDRIAAVFTGRPCCIQDEDYDLPFPKECDDEYWEHPQHPFIQPAGKPSYVTYYSCFIKLCIIQGRTLRIIYSSDRPKGQDSAKDSAWQRRVILQLDGELNQWKAELPTHLEWDSETADVKTLEQAANINAYYHYVRILIHRPFISIRDGSAAPLPLVVATHAAHAISDILHTVTLTGLPIQPIVQSAGLSAGVVLLLNIWASHCIKRPVDWDHEMMYVDQIMHVMQVSETRWTTAGRYWDVLNRLRWMPLDPKKLIITPRTTPKLQPDNLNKMSPDSFNPAADNTRVPQRADLPTPVASSSRMNGSHYPPPDSISQSSSMGQHLSAPGMNSYYHLPETPPKYTLPSSFGGLDSSMLMNVSPNLGSYRLHSPEFTQYTPEAAFYAQSCTPDYVEWGSNPANNRPAYPHTTNTNTALREESVPLFNSEEPAPPFNVGYYAPNGLPNHPYPQQ